MRASRVLAALVSATLAATLTPAYAASSPGRPTPVVGSPSGGDPYFPKDGNGGYDVLHYKIVNNYRPDTDHLTGSTTIRARADARLTAFHLDLVLTPTRVTVDGRPAAYVKTDRHTLRVRPAQAVARGTTFTVTVTYRGRPSIRSAAGISSPFTHIRGEGVAMGEPQNGAWWFAANETPRDKARFDITVRVPRGKQAVSNGVLVSKRSSPRWTAWHWRMRQPMATYLAFFVAGDFVVERGRANGRPVVVAVSERLPPSWRRDWLRALRRTPALVDWLSRQLGPYPFTETGGVAVAAADGYALETQSRPVYPGDAPPETRLLVHELAHQWFGDSVSVTRWRDIWLNEGFATYAEWLWYAERKGLPTAEILRKAYEVHGARSSYWRLRISDPGPARMFDTPVYFRGAMTLAALRNVIGEADHAALLRRWVAEHRLGHGTGAEFRALAEEVSGRDLDGFFRQWLDQRDRPADTEANGLGGLAPRV